MKEHKIFSDYARFKFPLSQFSLINFAQIPFVRTEVNHRVVCCEISPYTIIFGKCNQSNTQPYFVIYMCRLIRTSRLSFRWASTIETLTVVYKQQRRKPACKSAQCVFAVCMQQNNVALTLRFLYCINEIQIFYYCKFGNFHEGFIFAKLRICENKVLAK